MEKLSRRATDVVSKERLCFGSVQYPPGDWLGKTLHEHEEEFGKGEGLTILDSHFNRLSVIMTDQETEPLQETVLSLPGPFLCQALIDPDSLDVGVPDHLEGGGPELEEVPEGAQLAPGLQEVAQDNLTIQTGLQSLAC